MNMCLLELDMCEKFRSSHFEYEGGGVGSKKFEDWGVKDFRTRGLPIWGGATFDWGGGAVPHYMP